MQRLLGCKHLHPVMLLQASAQRAAVSAWTMSTSLKSVFSGAKDKKHLNAYMQPSSPLCGREITTK